MKTPYSCADVTPEWLTTVLEPHFPGVRVSGISWGDSDVGTAMRARAQLTYDQGEGPATVFLKGPGPLSNRILLSTMGAFFNEVRLLGHTDLVPLEVPTIYATTMQRWSLRSLIAMEDVTERGAVPNVAVHPLTVDQVMAGLEDLAALHSRFWDRPLPGELSWAGPWRWGPAYMAFPLTSGPKAVKRLTRLGRLDLLPTTVAWSTRYGYKLFRRSQIHHNSGPRTLVHGDAHVGNTFLLPDNRIGFLDWQVVRAGSWSHDVGYFITSALTVEDRRTNERELLEGYLKALESGGAGSIAPTFDDAWLRYRQTPAYGLPIWLGTHGLGYQNEDNCLVCIERFSRAFDDLETGAVIDRDLTR